MSKKNDKKIGIVFSTDPDFAYQLEDENQITETLLPEAQNLRVKIDRKQRGGKSVTLVEGFVGTDDDLKELEKMLKNKCGVGGTSKNGVIVVQGEWKEKIIDLLKLAGFKKTK